MSDDRFSRLPVDPQAAIELLQAELAETNREVMLLTLEMEQRVEARTAEAQHAREQLEKTNAELVALTRDLEKRVAERTEALRASEERYRLAAEGLATEARRKDQFLALLGHELRNPLAPIRTAVHVLRTSGREDATSERLHATIDRQVSHLAHLVDDLLDVSRIARGKIRLQKEPLDLVRLVRTTVEDLRSDLEAAGLTLKLRLPEGPAWVSGDATRLSQVVGNLLTNARKYTDAGGEVWVDFTVDGNRAVLVVTDTGIGIEPEMLPTLFEPFSQSERIRSRRGGGGLGLGLALVKGLAELHNGTATASSAGVGMGSTFAVTLPLISAAEEQPTPPHPSRASHRRILVVEDNQDAMTTLCLFLENVGHIVVQAADVASALARAREFRPDVVLSDIALSGERSGYDLAAAIRADETLGKPYLVALTGFGREDDRRRAHEAGFDIHLTKPVDPRTLEQVLANAPSNGTRSS